MLRGIITGKVVEGARLEIVQADGSLLLCASLRFSPVNGLTRHPSHLQFSEELCQPPSSSRVVAHSLAQSPNTAGLGAAGPSMSRATGNVILHASTRGLTDDEIQYTIPAHLRIMVVCRESRRGGRPAARHQQG